MFPVVIQKIIVDYTAPDVFVKHIVNLKWEHAMFFKMRLSCLLDIVKQLSINVSQQTMNPHNGLLGDNTDFDTSFVDIIYQLVYCDNDYTKYHTSYISYFLSKYTPISTSDYIKRYPNAIDFSGLCMNNHVDLQYLIYNHFNDIDWEGITVNESISTQYLITCEHVNPKWL
jgi:hypothetical protein